ncbi:MAG: purine-binding chemotaxis protein CheW [Deltaproteobacteria bacterium]|nr:purine-binding chemotaxis protein CheW [Deltaproteobacteria bacterium]
MANQADNKNTGNKTMELATFYVGDSLCGMDILKIQEINKLLEMTEVPLAPDYVKGILNLRGQIVTVIDLGNKLSLADTEISGETRNIIVNSNGEYIGLLVQKIGDVERTEEDKIESPPANIGGIQGRYFEGVFKKEKSLIGILNVEEILKDDGSQGL